MPRRVASPDINVEDFSAAVDYLMNREDVDSGKVGILGICGWGGIAIQAAINDPRIKATVASIMYDMTRVNANGYFDSENSAEQRNAKRSAMAAQRTIDFRNGEYKRAGGVVDPLPEDAPQFVKDYHAYYKTPRGYHVRSGNSTDSWNVRKCPAISRQRQYYADNLITVTSLAGLQESSLILLSNCRDSATMFLWANQILWSLGLIPESWNG